MTPGGLFKSQFAGESTWQEIPETPAGMKPFPGALLLPPPVGEQAGMLCVLEAAPGTSAPKIAAQQALAHAWNHIELTP